VYLENGQFLLKTKGKSPKLKFATPINTIAFLALNKTGDKDYSHFSWWAFLRFFDTEEFPDEYRLIIQLRSGRTEYFMVSGFDLFGVKAAITKFNERLKNGVSETD
jgi:hypothetical protein